MKKILAVGFLAALFLMVGIHEASAHAVVSPNQANVGEFVNFNLGVPSEKPLATIAVRLLLPAGLNEVTPFVKPGWKIEVKKDGDTVTEIDWSGGSVPPDEKDGFLFSAQVPDQATTLPWKVYQTYQDGSVVSWNQDPSQPQAKDTMGNMDFSKFGPYSQTKITDDLTPTTASLWSKDGSAIATVLGLFAVVLAGCALMKKR